MHKTGNSVRAKKCAYKNIYKCITIDDIKLSKRTYVHGIPLTHQIIILTSVAVYNPSIALLGLYKVVQSCTKLYKTVMQLLCLLGCTKLYKATLLNVKCFSIWIS